MLAGLATGSGEIGAGEPLANGAGEPDAAGDPLVAGAGSGEACSLAADSFIADFGCGDGDGAGDGLRTGIA